MCSSVGFLGLVSSGLFVALLLFGVWDQRSVGGGFFQICSFFSYPEFSRIDTCLYRVPKSTSFSVPRHLPRFMAAIQQSGTKQA